MPLAPSGFHHPTPRACHGSGRFPEPRQHQPVPKLQEGRQEKHWLFPGDPRWHYPVLKLQRGRQEEILMVDNVW